MVVTLYFHPVSQPSRAVGAFLKVADVKHTAKVVDVFKGEHKKKEFEKLFPVLQQIPAIDYDGERFVESVAILRLIASKNPRTIKSNWFGKSPEEEARLFQILGWYPGKLRMPCIGVFLPTLRSVMDLNDTMKKEPINEDAVGKAKDEVKKAVKIIEENFLKKNKFLIGSEISIADLLIFSELYQLYGVKEESLYTTNSKVNAWMKSVETHEKLKKPIEEVFTEIKKLRESFSAPAKGAKTPQQTTMDVTLYYNPISQPSRTVKVFLNAAQVKHNTKVVDVFKGEHKTSEFCKLFPIAQQVPAIAYGNERMVESLGILRLIASKNPDTIKKNWFGTTPEEEGRLFQVVGWYPSKLRKPCIDVFLPHMRSVMDLNDSMKKQPMDAGAVSKAKDEIKKAVKEIEDKFLYNKKFLIGNEISVADLLVFSELYQLFGIGQEDLYMSNTKVRAWANSVENDEKLKKHIEEVFAEVKKLRGLFSAPTKGAKK